MQTENLKIAGMSCGGCTSTVTNALQAVTEVSEINISLATSETAVQYDERLTSLEQLKAAVQGVGYSVGATDNVAQQSHGKGCCCS